jgi:hypothetical protein
LVDYPSVKSSLVRYLKQGSLTYLFSGADALPTEDMDALNMFYPPRLDFGFVFYPIFFNIRRRPVFDFSSNCLMIQHHDGGYKDSPGVDKPILGKYCFS